MQVQSNLQYNPSYVKDEDVENSKSVVELTKITQMDDIDEMQDKQVSG